MPKTLTRSFHNNKPSSLQVLDNITFQDFLISTEITFIKATKIFHRYIRTETDTGDNRDEKAIMITMKCIRISPVSRFGIRMSQINHKHLEEHKD